MKAIGNIYQHNGKTFTAESFYGKDQAIAVCREVKPEFSFVSDEDYVIYEKVGPSFELTKADLTEAKRINKACDNCVFCRTSMHDNDINKLMAVCDHARETTDVFTFFVDCNRQKTEKDIKRIDISVNKAKKIFTRFFKDCRLICGSGIESDNDAIKIESVSVFEKGWWLPERLINRKNFNALLKKATGKVLVVENFLMLLSKQQCLHCVPEYTHFKVCEIQVKDLDYDTYVYFCCKYGCNAFIFEDLGMGLFTLYELTYKVTL